jgi:hypothetical protein
VAGIKTPPAVTVSWFCNARTDTAVEDVVVLATDGGGAQAKPLASCAVSLFENVPSRLAAYAAPIRLTRPGDGATTDSWEISSYDASVPLMQMNAPSAVPVSCPDQVSLPPCDPPPLPPQDRQSSAAAAIVSFRIRHQGPPDPPGPETGR